jgi:hypothetical protein
LAGSDVGSDGGALAEYLGSGNPLAAGAAETAAAVGTSMLKPLLGLNAICSGFVKSAEPHGRGCRWGIERDRRTAPTTLGRWNCTAAGVGAIVSAEDA